MSNLYSQQEYYTGEFRPLQLIIIVVFGTLFSRLK